jgi:hypothetical protein
MNDMRGRLSARLFPAALVALVVGFGLYLDHAAASYDARAAFASKETAMKQRTDGKDAAAGHAKHGARSEITWEGGSGRQPYSNRGQEEAAEPNAPDDEVPEGDRGDRSGRNLDQLAEAKRKP